MTYTDEDGAEWEDITLTHVGGMPKGAFWRLLQGPTPLPERPCTCRHCRVRRVQDIPTGELL